jgi:hypothetical protein
MNQKDVVHICPTARRKSCNFLLKLTKIYQHILDAEDIIVNSASTDVPEARYFRQIWVGDGYKALEGSQLAVLATGDSAVGVEAAYQVVEHDAQAPHISSSCQPQRCNIFCLGFFLDSVLLRN